MKWATTNTYSNESFWGLETGVGKVVACATAQDRILAQFLEDGNFYDLMCVFAEHHGDFWDVAADVKSGFDLDSAIGVQLDKIGKILKQPRNAFDDPTYRKLLNIKGKLVLRSTGTGENVLEICRTFIGTEPDPIILTNAPPYNFKLTVPGTTSDDLNVLIPFIRAAIPAAVLGMIIVIVPGGALWGSQSVAVSGDGIWGSQSVVVPGATLWSRTLQI